MSQLTPLILNSLPKSGTHLLTRVFTELPGYSHTGVTLTYQTAEGCEDGASQLLVGVSTPRGMKRPEFVQLMESVKPGEYHFGHLPYSPATREVLDSCGIRMVAILRDPRAVVCSFVYFILSRPDHPLHSAFSNLETLEAQIALAIRGFRPGPENGFLGLLPLAACFQSVAHWAGWPAAAMVSFEELIGPRGGGTVKAQERALERILRHVGYELEEEGRAALSRRLFSQESVTFRKGQIADWCNHFTPELERCFEEHAGQTLLAYSRIFPGFDL